MVKVSLFTLVRYCDTLLQTEQYEDWSGAVNGLQVENSGVVTCLAAAVDANLATVQLAIAAGANLLLAHHGLFWSAAYPWVGKRYELIGQLWENNLAVYSSHLPLDAHKRLGNNYQLAAAIGLKKLRPFFVEKGKPIGCQATLSISRIELTHRLTQVLGQAPVVAPAGPAQCRRIGVVSGAAGADLARAAEQGVDTFITGEGPHWSYGLAEDLGLNVFYGGHYATETFGVKALAAHLAKQFHLPWHFIDHPTGL